MKPPPRLLLPIVCLVALGLTGCGGSAEPTAQQPAPSAAKPTRSTQSTKPTQPANKPTDWCRAWEDTTAAMTELNRIAALEKGTPVAEVEAAAHAEQVALDNMLAAAPPDIRSDAQLFHDKFAKTADDLVKIYRGEPTDVDLEPDSKYDEAFARLAKQVSEQCG